MPLTTPMVCLVAWLCAELVSETMIVTWAAFAPQKALIWLRMVWAMAAMPPTLS